MSWRLEHGDCRALMAALAPDSVDAIATDPPYGLIFMGKEWDYGVPGVPFWTEALRVLKPGGHLAAFGGTRTFHRLACAIEDAGFEIRDCLCWLYGSGFPKSLDVSKALDKAAGAERGTTYAPNMKNAAKQWAGFGTALKPAYEPIILARKPLAGTVAANVLAHGTGALNVDGCRIAWEGGGQEFVERTARPNTRGQANVGAVMNRPLAPTVNTSGLGRWPANLVLDEDAARALDEQSGELTSGLMRAGAERHSIVGYRGGPACNVTNDTHGDTGGASRFFFVCEGDQCESAKGADRNSSPPKERGDSALSGAPTVAVQIGLPGIAGPDSIENFASSTRLQSRAANAEGPEGTDTTPTIRTCCASCGSVLPVTDAPINPDERERAGGASVQASGTRFWYTSKASSAERHYAGRNSHPTVKPVSLMRWLVRLITPPGGLVLDPFAGSGSTGIAALAEGLRFVGMELDAESVAVARRRIAGPLFADVVSS